MMAMQLFVIKRIINIMSLFIIFVRGDGRADDIVLFIGAPRSTRPDLPRPAWASPNLIDR